MKPQPTLVQTLYFDFGGNESGTRGEPTVSPDNNGNYWNNIINNDGFLCKERALFIPIFVNSRNDQTGFSLTLNSFYG